MWICWRIMKSTTLVTTHANLIYVNRRGGGLLKASIYEVVDLYRFFSRAVDWYFSLLCFSLFIIFMNELSFEEQVKAKNRRKLLLQNTKLLSEIRHL